MSREKKIVWKKCLNPEDWVCEACDTCGDPSCRCTHLEARWFKHLGDDFALCDHCFDAHRAAIERKFLDQ